MAEKQKEIPVPQLTRLARPFPREYVEPPPQGKYGEYVPHDVVTQALLVICGPFDWQLVEIIRGNVPGYVRVKDGQKTTVAALTDVVVAVIYRLTVTIDGRVTVIEEVGDVDQPHNWSDDGKRLKDAVSDAKKRCAMQVGCGLHLWAQNQQGVSRYFLHRQLVERNQPKVPAAGGREAAASETPSGKSVPSDHSPADDGAPESEVVVSDLSGERLAL